MTKTLVRYIVILAAVALVVGGGVAALFATFRPTIEQREAKAVIESIRQVCPPESTPDLDSPVVGRPLRPGAEPDPDAVFAATKGGRIVAYVAQGSAKGYASTVRVMVGVRAATLEIVDVAVVSQNETPGLGANVAQKSSNFTLWEKLLGPAGAGKTERLVNPFLDQFEGRTAAGLDEVDAITGATITSSATRAAVRRAIDRIREAVRQNPVDAPPRAD